jgi:hypothetical protein
MPTMTVPADVFLDAHGVVIYHVYKNDDISQGIRKFWYSLDPDSRDQGMYEDYQGFDVRDLPAYQETVTDHTSVSDDSIKEALKLALVRGELEDLIEEAKRDGVIEQEQ